MSTHVFTGTDLSPVVNAIQLAMVINANRRVDLGQGVSRVPIDKGWELVYNQSRHFRRAARYGLADGDLIPESVVVLYEGEVLGMLHMGTQTLAWATPIQDAITFAAVVAYQFSDSILNIDVSLKPVEELVQ